MDLAKPVTQTSGPTFDSLVTQAKNAQDGLGSIGQQLKDPNLKLKRSQSQLLKHKLQDANDHIRAAGERAGVPTPGQKTPGSGPFAHFLGMIGQGQDDLIAVQNEVKKLSADPEHLRPGDMMYMQIKMGQAQQEIEYSSTLLGKAVDALKQVLNTQL
jgi:flagellar hook-basal body complex protein FliE